MAAADCGQYGSQPPAELELAWACERYNSPPGSGNILEQDPALLNRMAECLTTFDAFCSMVESGDQEAWAKSHPRYMKTVARVQAMRLKREMGEANDNGS